MHERIRFDFHFNATIYLIKTYYINIKPSKLSSLLFSKTIPCNQSSYLYKLPPKHFNPSKSLKFESHFLDFAMFENTPSFELAGRERNIEMPQVAALILVLSCTILLDSPYFSYQYLTATVEDFTKLLDIVIQLVYLDHIS